jgi:hypothetical protein
MGLSQATRVAQRFGDGQALHVGAPGQGVVRGPVGQASLPHQRRQARRRVTPSVRGQQAAGPVQPLAQLHTDLEPPPTGTDDPRADPGGQ